MSTAVQGFLIVLAGFMTIGAALTVAAVIAWVIDHFSTRVQRHDKPLPGALGSSPWPELDEAEKQERHLVLVDRPDYPVFDTDWEKP